MVLRRVDLIQLARQRLALGERLLRKHQVDGVGCCGYCGRPYPCQRVSLGDALVRHYRGVLRVQGVSTSTDPPQPEPDDRAHPSSVEADDAAV